MNVLLFVDDHPLYRDGIRRLALEGLTDVEVLTAGSVEQALQVLDGRPTVDLCLSDFILPDGDGLALLAEVRQRHPTVARGLLCAGLTPDLVRRARIQGSIACLSKERDADSMLKVFARLFEGEEHFDVEPGQPDQPWLTEKRREILRLAVKGLSNKEISRLLGVSERTIKDHWSFIFIQLGASNRTEAVGIAMRERLL